MSMFDSDSSGKVLCVNEIWFGFSESHFDSPYKPIADACYSLYRLLKPEGLSVTVGDIHFAAY